MAVHNVRLEHPCDQWCEAPGICDVSPTRYNPAPGGTHTKKVSCDDLLSRTRSLLNLAIAFSKSDQASMCTEDSSQQTQARRSACAFSGGKCFPLLWGTEYWMSM